MVGPSKLIDERLLMDTVGANGTEPECRVGFAKSTA
jgi:hypothetical protein